MYNFIYSLKLLIYETILKHLPPTYYPGGVVIKKLRYLFCRNLFRKCGRNICIEPNAVISFSKIEIGDYSGIGQNARVQAAIIGRYVMMGPEVIILSKNHTHNDIQIPMCEQGDTNDLPVNIQDDVWIGARTIILPGVNIGRGSIIAAGSVVSKDVDEYSIVAGNPAIKIKMRK